MEPVTISTTQLRASIYRVLDEVLETGRPVEVERKGRRVRIIAVDPPGRLERLRRRPLLVDCDPQEIVHLDWSGEWRP